MKAVKLLCCSLFLLALQGNLRAEAYAGGERFSTTPTDDSSLESIAFRIGSKILPSLSVEARGNIAMSDGFRSELDRTSYVLGVYSKFITNTESLAEPYLIMGWDTTNNVGQVDSWWYHGDPTRTSELNMGAGVEYDLGPSLKLVSELLHQDNAGTTSVSLGFSFSF